MASDMSDGSVFGVDDESDAYVPEVVSVFTLCTHILRRLFYPCSCGAGEGCARTSSD
jgi:hypothetical protein